MNDDLIEIELLEWDKYQYKNGSKTYDWFKMSSSFFVTHELRNLSPSVRIVWLYLMCSAAQVRRSVLKVQVKCIASDCKVYSKQVVSAILLFQRYQLLRVLSGTFGVPSGYQMGTLEEKRREEKRKEEKKNLNPAKGKKEKQEIKIGKPILAPSLVWESYRISYQNKYNVDPVRNSMVNAQIKQLINRVGEENAIELVKFYLAHKDSFYSLKLHPIGLCLKDCEGLLTQMRSGVSVTKAGFKNQENQNWYKEQMERMSVDKE